MHATQPNTTASFARLWLDCQTNVLLNPDYDVSCCSCCCAPRESLENPSVPEAGARV
ncbi:hypothetical protein BDP27DRAFT_1346075, partial [Rhodocollybia butyracea]